MVRRTARGKLEEGGERREERAYLPFLEFSIVHYLVVVLSLN